ncbi:GGDEF domain-containing protein [Bacillus infantis]|uniref:GGDEF domain-containing protein n=1 Tax=Bacillus infantis TaxID=324767 RepID=UPI00209ED536|nr:GGDEF domain-containing protein [Bacillus infantis]MCP1157111.1 GGDEF domain-containing protein [Bacillus infantis]
MQATIGEIAERVMFVAPSTKCEYVYSIFKETPEIEGVVVCMDSRPVGLVSKTKFYQKLSTQYGFDLFMKRKVELVMIPEPLVIDHSVPITEASALAMDRTQEQLYDYVIVTKEDLLIGTVSIRNLLMKLAEEQISIARYSNPLTGLPGNFEIKNALKKAMSSDQYTVLYIDINSFKTFNDTFGFKTGDEVIQATAAIMKDVIAASPMSSHSFIGHIGGDDFIAVFPHHNYQNICSAILERFDDYARSFYSEEELKEGCIQAVNRMGIPDSVPILGLSIAVVLNTNTDFQTIEELSREAARLKKHCKSFRKSVYLTLEDEKCCQALEEYSSGSLV